MIIFLTIPVIFYFTFKNMIESNWLFIDGGMSHANFLGWVFTVIVGIIISCLISLIPMGIADLIGSIPKRRAVLLQEYDLITLREKDGMSGKFFLGTGSIDGTEYYFWYRKNKDGSIGGGKTERKEEVQIFETDGNPKMKEFVCEYENKHVRNYMWIIGMDKTGNTYYNPQFFIPKGSIKEGYTL